jgi:hypothetical protein
MDIFERGLFWMRLYSAVSLDIRWWYKVHVLRSASRDQFLQARQLWSDASCPAERSKRDIHDRHSSSLASSMEAATVLG